MKPVVSRNPETVAARILDAAEAEFMRAGYEAASTNVITEGFGGSKATLFRHFATKQLLIEAVIRRIAGRWRGHIDWERIKAEDPRGWLTAFGVQSLEWILSPDVLFVGRLGIAEGHKLPELRNVFTETAAAPLEEVVAERLEAWTAEGLLASRNPRQDAVHFLDVLMSGAVSRALYGVEALSRSARRSHAQRAVDLFLDGRRPRPGAG